MSHVFTLMPSPVGQLKLVADSQSLVAVLWENDPPGRVRLGQLTADARHPVLQAASQQLDEYFAGSRRTFDLPLVFTGTDFQQRVWQALLEIPYGSTRTYSQLATQLGDPKAVRAVGAANGKNPLSIIAPCHRVIGASGSLTGFAGGLTYKAWLLQHESHAAPFAAQPDARQPTFF